MTKITIYTRHGLPETGNRFSIEGNRLLRHEDSNFIEFSNENGYSLAFQKDDIFIIQIEKDTKPEVTPKTIEWDEVVVDKIDNAPKDGRVFLAVKEGYVPIKVFWNGIKFVYADIETVSDEVYHYEPTHWFKDI